MCTPKAGLPSGNIRVLPTRISCNWDRKASVHTRSDPRITTEPNQSSSQYATSCGLVQQASVRVRKRKSCNTLPRMKRPGLLLGIGGGKAEAGGHVHQVQPIANSAPISTCKKRVEFHSQPRLDKLSLITGVGTSVSGINIRRVAHESAHVSSSLLNDKDSNRYHVFSYQQVKRLDSLLQTQLCISPRPVQWDYYGLVPGFYPDFGRCFTGSASSTMTANGANIGCPVSSTDRCSLTGNGKHSKITPDSTPSDCTQHDGNGRASPESKSAGVDHHQDQHNTSVPGPPGSSAVPRVKQQNGRTEPVHCMPVICVQLKQLIRTIRDRLLEEQITVREIRLNGGAAGCVISLEENNTYSDLDVIFSVDLSNSVNFTKIKSVVFSSIAQFLADTFACGNLVYSCAQNTAASSTQSLRSAKQEHTMDRRADSGDKQFGVTPGVTGNLVGKIQPETTGSANNTAAPTDCGNRPRARCSHSFTSEAETANSMDDHHPFWSPSTPLATTLACTNSKSTTTTTTTTSAIATQTFTKVAQNRRASEHSIAIGAGPADPCCDPTMMMMALTSCFFCSPFHTFPCAQTWSRMLRDESLVKQYIQKMVRIHKPSSKTADSWSLFTLGYRTPDGGKTVDVKFVDRMQRPFEFTVDSFQIVLDSLMAFYETSRQPMDEHFYPTVVAESVAGSFIEALAHLTDHVIVTPRPEEIRGGGLLKYCKLLVDGYRPSTNTDVLSMERYMCSRFFIDFPDIVSQHQRLTYYLINHFDNNDTTKATYLQILHEVVSHSTVCLMTHERQQTLCLIRMLLQDVLSRSEIGKTGVHLEEFSTDNWALDSIYYGTTYFPKQLYLLSDPVTLLPSTDSMSGCLLYGESFNPSLNCDINDAQSQAHQQQTCDQLNKKNTQEHGEYIQTDDNNVNNDNNNKSLHRQPVLNVNNKQGCNTADPTVASAQCNGTMLNVRIVGDAPIEPVRMDTSSPAMPSLLPCTPSEPHSDSHLDVENAICEDAMDPNIDAAGPQILTDNCFTDVPANPYLNGPLYYIPQVVTYFPTPVKYSKESDEVSNQNDNTHNDDNNNNSSNNKNNNNRLENNDSASNAEVFTSIDTSSASKSMPHYHAGIILPRIESTGTAEMNHYVGVPCSDMQYPSYSNYANGLIDSSDCLSYPSSVYCYQPDSGYLVYANPVLQNSPTLILAYPI